MPSEKPVAYSLLSLFPENNTPVIINTDRITVYTGRNPSQISTVNPIASDIKNTFFENPFSLFIDANTAMPNTIIRDIKKSIIIFQSPFIRSAPIPMNPISVTIKKLSWVTVKITNINIIPKAYPILGKTVLSNIEGKKTINSHINPDMFVAMYVPVSVEPWSIQTLVSILKPR
jgi:hypothetical protein